MEIDSTEEYFQDIFSILKELKTKQLENRGNNFLYNIRLFPPEKIKKQDIFRNLEEEGVVSWDHEEGQYDGQIGEPKEKGFMALLTLELNLIEPKFSTLYKKYKTAFQEPNKVRINKKTGETELTLGGIKTTSKFTSSSDAFQALVKLAENQGRKLAFDEIVEVTKEREHSNQSTEERARKLISSIRKKLKHRGEDFIKTEYGFRLVCGVEFL